MCQKSQLICNICKLVLSNEPVLLPCSHAMCGEHLRDGTIKDFSIQCLECEQVFAVPSNGFPPNNIASNFLAKDLQLSEEEKAIKYAIQETIQQLEQLQSDVKQKHSDLERISFDHFSEIRRKIDLEREELKYKIDEIALKMIDQVNEKEKAYYLSMKQSFLAAYQVDIKECRQNSVKEFRNPNLIIEKVKRLKTEHEQMSNEIQARFIEFDSFNEELKSVRFKAGPNIRIETFGDLLLNEFNSKAACIVACANGNSIQIWNLKSKECVATLEGHTMPIMSLENIDDNRFASGSADETIRIWDAKNFVCLKILNTDNKKGVEFLKSLPSNKLASCSFDDEIKVWDIESGECFQNHNVNSDWIRSRIYLPNGNLVSCSDDETIKVWDLVKGVCIKTLKGHSNWVYGLYLLKNGQLVSGSWDKTIKIWNIESGECIKTIRGHLNRRLQQLESGELVSCSNDCTIKIWDLEESTCFRTLVGHTDWIESIRLNGQNNTLVSCSFDGTIKAWNLKTGKCVNTIDVKNDAVLRDLILI